jgi:serine phosphatase RsbU (regulator of sigma subunit)
MYGTERLEEVVMHINSTMNAEEIIETILQDVSDFVGSAEQYDDMTVVVLKRL